LCSKKYDEAALLLKSLGLINKKITLGTNNSKKIEALQSIRIEIVESKSIISTNLSSTAKANLQAKAKE